MSDDSGILNRVTGGVGSSSTTYSDVVEVRFRNLIGELKSYEEEELPDDAEEQQYYGEARIVRPTDGDILQAALERLQHEGAKERMREEVGVVDDPSGELNNPAILLDDFETALNGLHDDLLESLGGERMDVDEEARHIGDDDIDPESSFAYLLAELDKGIIIGGAGNIIDNLAEHLDLSDVEREFVRLAYDESVRVSDLGDIRGHTLIEDVLVVWNPDEI